jgi:hypothetical protein
LAFSIAEQNRLLGVLDSERFADTAPAAVYPTIHVENCRSSLEYRLPRSMAQRFSEPVE